MKRNLKLLFAVMLGFLLPSLALAVNFQNPASKFFIDLMDFGKPNTFQGLLLYLVELLLGIVGLVSVAFIIYGGYQYIISRGDEERALSGKKTLTNAIIGLVIVILSYVIVTVIINALMGKVQ